MSVIDRFSGMARCPGCHEVHYIANQTQLLEPSHQARSYRAGVVHEKQVDPRILTVDLWQQQWWRMRAPIAGATHVDVLHWIEDVFACSCERVLVPVLRFAIGETTTGLEEIRLLDLDRPGLERELDLVGQWAPSPELAELPALPIEERVAWLRAQIAPRREPRPVPPGWTTIVGPTQCEACDDVRERTITTVFTQPHSDVALLGSELGARTIYLGDRVRVGASWQPREGFYTVLRPIGDTLAVLSRQYAFGCACGAGRAAFVQRFARRGEELELVELALRVVREERDLEDIEIVEGRSPRDSGLAAIVARYPQWT